MEAAMGITFTALDSDNMPVPFDEDHHQPNCSVGNQALVIRVLGFIPAPDGDEYGDCDARDFYARVTLALAVLDDLNDEIPATTVGGNWHRGGRTPGYLIAKLHELSEHALWCAAHGYRVQWT
jgi:hypothetical protein